MAEIAGLVLSGIPVVIWALEKYAEPVKAYRQYSHTISTFRANLILQNRHLRASFANIGLSDDPSVDELRECFKTKFPGVSDELMIIIKEMNRIIAELMKSLDIDVRSKPEVLSDRVQWEWRKVKHSLNSRKRDQIIQSLRNTNSDLKNLIEQSNIPTEDNNHKVSAVKRRFNLRRCDSIRARLNSLHQALEAGFCCTCSPIHQAAIKVDWKTYDCNTKNFDLAVSFVTSSRTPGEDVYWQNLRVTSEKLKPTTYTTIESSAPSDIPAQSAPSSASNSSFKSISLNFIKKVLRKTSPAPRPTLNTLTVLSHGASTASSTSPASTSTRVTSICASMGGSGTSAISPGYLQDLSRDSNERFCLDTNRASSPSIYKIMSLKTLLLSQCQASQQRNVLLRMTAKQRFGVATAIAWSVLHMSGSSWIGEEWDQDQVSMFIERWSLTGSEMVSEHPCLSCHFPSAANPTTSLSDEMQHLVPNTTIFKLGIILIELCLNKPIIIRRSSGTPGTLRDDYDAAIKASDEVYLIAGDSYGYAVERCIKCSFQGRHALNNFDSPQFRQQFHDTVVAPVQATYLMMP